LPPSETVLSPEVYALLGSDNKERKNVVVLLLTCDSSGYPRVALLSPYQILAVDNIHLFLHVYRESQSNRNLREKKKATLVIVTPPSIRYVRISMDSSPWKNDDADEELHRFKVEEERADYSQEAPITSSLLFDETKIKERYEMGFAAMLLTARNS
jgi:hypothetical protein